MNWLAILGIVVVVVALAALFGLKPAAGRPVAKTRLMTAARVTVVLAIVIFGLLAFSAWSGG